MLRRFFVQPGLSFYVVIASFFVHFLGLASTIYVMQVFNRYVGYGLDGTLLTLTVGVVLAVIFEFCFRLVRQRFMHALCAEPEKQTSQMVAQTSALADMSSLAKEHAPRSMIATLELWQQTYSPSNLTTIVDTPFAAMFVLVVALLNPVLSLILLGTIAVMIAIHFLVKKVQHPLQENLRKEQQRSAAMVRSLQEMETVRAFNLGQRMIAQWQVLSSAVQSLRYKVAHHNNSTQSVTTALVAFNSVAVIAIGSMSVVAGDLTIGAVIGANILSARALAIFVRLISLTPALVQAEQSHQRIKSFLSSPSERQEGFQLQRVEGRITFQGLCFGYPQVPTPIIDRLNGTINAGDVLVISGDNGTGKSTLARILAGLVHPQRGQLLVDGYDVRQVSIASYRKHLMYMPQEARFFDGTLADNLRSLNPTAPDNSLLQVLAAVGLDNFVRTSVDGLAMPITSQAEALAYGVRRRLALARGLIGGGQIWVLDEINEGVDPKGVEKINQLIDQAVEAKRTVIICASSPDAYAHAHYVLDLNQKDQLSLTQVNPHHPASPAQQ